MKELPQQIGAAILSLAVAAIAGYFFGVYVGFFEGLSGL